MSLYKQLWISVGLLMIVVFGITFYLNSASSSRYLQEQLTIKNSDDATALALSLSQQSLDPVSIELQLSTQLDQSSYEFIELKDPEGQILFRREKTLDTVSVPLWLRQLFPINGEEGRASVTNGWNQIGELTIKSHDDFAYAELWSNAQRMVIALIMAVIIAGIVGSLLLKVILNPLKSVVAQASAIGERRFLTVPEPFTTEFKHLTQSMNQLSNRVREMLNREAKRLELQREISELDTITGVLTREAFMRRLRARLESDGADANGVIVLLRINNLGALNQQYGHNTLDTVLKEMGADLKRLAKLDSEWAIGRLNGSDFCLLAPQENHPKVLAEQLQSVVYDALLRHAMDARTALPTAATEYASGDSIAKVMTTLDGALMAAEATGDNDIIVGSPGSGHVTPAREQAEYWRRELSIALDEQRLLLETYSVIDAKGELLHKEGMVRLRIGDRLCSAGEFMPWVQRLDLALDLDRAVVTLGLEQINAQKLPVHINLSAASLNDLSFAVWLESTLLDQRELAPQFGLEVGEAAAYATPEGFRRLAKRVQPLGVQVGIEHMGYRLKDVSKLSELGADYIKVDSLFVREIDHNTGNEALVRTYINIAHSLGLPCIAEGVNNEAEQDAVIALGIDGLTGPGIKGPEAS